MKVLFALSFLFAIESFARTGIGFGGEPCTVPLLSETKTYDCVVPGAYVTVSVRETEDRDGWWKKGGVVSYHIIDARTKKVLDSGQESVLRSCETNDYMSGGKELRQYYFGRTQGDGSLVAYVLSDNDRSVRRIWINSIRVPSANGYFSCRLRH